MLNLLKYTLKNWEEKDMHPLYDDKELTYDEYLAALNTPVSEEDAEQIMLEEDYDEEMFERRANGIKTTSFSAWKKQKEIMASLFKK